MKREKSQRKFREIKHISRLNSTNLWQPTTHKRPTMISALVKVATYNELPFGNNTCWLWLRWLPLWFIDIAAALMNLLLVIEGKTFINFLRFRLLSEIWLIKIYYTANGWILETVPKKTSLKNLRPSSNEIRNETESKSGFSGSQQRNFKGSRNCVTIEGILRPICRNCHMKFLLPLP